MFRRRRAVVAIILAFAVVGCTNETPSAPSTTPPGSAGSAPSAGGTPSATPPNTPVPTPSAAGPVTKLLVFIAENHSLSQMRADLPFTFGLAQRYGYAIDYTAIMHPSLPNYLAIASGDTHGITDNDDPAENPVTGPSVFGQALAAGKTAGAVYADGMPHNCATEDGESEYAVRHNPWPYFTEERDDCQKYDVPVDQLDAAIAEGTLPNAGMVIPDLCNDAHDCSLATADAWFEDQMSKIMAGPDWASGRLVVVFTADEDDHSEGNRVLTVVAHQGQEGKVVSTPLTHYSLSRLYSEVTGTSPLGEARTAPSMAEAFDLRGGFRRHTVTPGAVHLIRTVRVIAMAVTVPLPV